MHSQLSHCCKLTFKTSSTTQLHTKITKCPYFKKSFQYLATWSWLNYTIYDRKHCFFKALIFTSKSKGNWSPLWRQTKPQSLLLAHRSRCCCYRSDKTKNRNQGKTRQKGGLQILFIIYLLKWTFFIYMLILTVFNS